MLFFYIQLQDAQSVSELRNLLDSKELDFRFDIGVCTPSATVELRDGIDVPKSCAAHFTIHSVKSELDQLCDGLSTMNVLQLMKENASVMKPLLLSRNPAKLTADSMINMFVTILSPEGSNLRDSEEAAAMKWIQYLQMIEGEERGL